MEFKLDFEPEIYKNFYESVHDIIGNEKFNVIQKITVIQEYIKDKKISKKDSLEMMVLSIYEYSFRALDYVYQDLYDVFKCICGQSSFLSLLVLHGWDKSHLNVCDMHQVIHGQQDCDDNDRQYCKNKVRIISSIYFAYLMVRGSDIDVMDGYPYFRMSISRTKNPTIETFLTAYFEMILEIMSIKDEIIENDVHNEHVNGGIKNDNKESESEKGYTVH